MPRKGSITRRNRDSQELTKDNRVFLYIRASTPDQVNSLDAQMAAATRFAEANSLQIDGKEIDAGVSAIKHAFRDRPGAQRMLRTMKSRGIRTIMVLRVDRAFRSSLDFSQTLAWVRDQGLSFRFIDPDIDLGTPMGEMFIQIQVALAQLEGDIRSARVDGALDSLRDNRLSRNGSQAPYGWRAEICTDGTTTRQGTSQYRHLPIPEEQTVLRHILHLWEQDKEYGALTRIANTLNSEGIPSKMAGKTMKKHGRTIRCSGLWQPGNVRSVIEHAVLATDAELIDGIPDLPSAIATLREKARQWEDPAQTNQPQLSIH